VTSLLGAGSEFSGKLTFEGAVRIDGRFSGEIMSEGVLVVGQQAEIEADVMVRSLVVQGNISGSLTAQEAIELRSPARVRGTLIAPEVSMEKGVVFDGSCEMSGAAGDAEKPSGGDGSKRQKTSKKPKGSKRDSGGDPDKARGGGDHDDKDA